MMGAIKTAPVRQFHISRDGENVSLIEDEDRVEVTEHSIKVLRTKQIDDTVCLSCFIYG